MRKIKYLQVLLLAAFCGLALISCASTPKTPVLTECPERFFWKIEGLDTKGEKSTIFIQGTIHVGDEKILPLPEAVESAFEKADRYVAEVSSRDMEALPGETINYMIDSYSEEYDIRNSLSYRNLENLKKLLPDEQIASIANFEPWVLTSMLTGVMLQGAEVLPDYGLDNYFYKKVEEKGKKVEGLDTLKTQMDLLRYGDYKTQLIILEDMLSEYPFDTSKKELNILYKAYLNNDKETLYLAMKEEEETGDELSDAYLQEMYTKRNTVWAQKFDEYLKRGGTTFVFAGSAHFLGLDSVFEIMRSAGNLK